MGYLGEFEQLILFSVLELGEEAFGVAIRETIEERTGKVVSSGAIYTALGRLEERGFVASRVGEPVEGRAGRPRKYYTLEPGGTVGAVEGTAVIAPLGSSGLSFNGVRYDGVFLALPAANGGVNPPCALRQTTGSVQ